MQTGRRIGHRKGAIARAFRAEHIAEWRAAARAGMHRIDRSYARDAIVAYESPGALASGAARRRDGFEGGLAHALPPCRHGNLAVRIFHGQHPPRLKRSMKKPSRNPSIDGFRPGWFPLVLRRGRL